MQGQQYGGQDGPPGFRQQVNFLLFVFWALAAPVEALLRRFGTVGELHFRTNALVGLVLMFVIVVFGGGPDAGKVAVWSAALVFLCYAIHASERRKRERAGLYVHSRYDGTPRIPGDELRVKGGAEPAVVAVAAMIAWPLSAGLAVYLLLASLSLAVVYTAAKQELHARRRAVRDAAFENEAVMGAPEREE